MMHERAFSTSEVGKHCSMLAVVHIIRALHLMLHKCAFLPFCLVHIIML